MEKIEKMELLQILHLNLKLVKYLKSIHLKLYTN